MPASSSTVESVELRITHVGGSESVYRAMKQGISESEERIVQGTHSTIDRLSEGSITIWLHTESSDAKEKLRHFIESGDISTFLESLFKTKGVRKLLTKDKYKIEIEIKVKNATEGTHIMQTCTCQFNKFLEYKMHCKIIFNFIESLIPIDETVDIFCRNDIFISYHVT